jgi:hypothetical protein
MDYMQEIYEKRHDYYAKYKEEPCVILMSPKTYYEMMNSLSEMDRASMAFNKKVTGEEMIMGKVLLLSHNMPDNEIKVGSIL